MEFSQRAWVHLALLAAITGAGLVLFAAVGFLLGWTELGGARHGTNVVPFSLFAGLCGLLISGAIILLRAPEILPQSHQLFAIAFLAVISLLFVVVELRNIAPLIRLPVDLVMGSESQFVDHVIRYRAGQPQYTPLEDANSSAYAPAPHLLTYWLAALIGRPTSIPTYRMIQQLYILIAVVCMVFAARSLLLWIRPGHEHINLWLFFWVPFLYLNATSPSTNAYTFSLYSDGLGLAANALSFLIFVQFAISRDDRWLIPMAFMPALGFLAKQKEVVWIGLFAVYFFFIGRLFERRILLFLAASLVLVGLAIGICYAAWGQPYWIWNFRVLSNLHISLQTIVSQLYQAGWFILPGFIGGLLLLRGDDLPRLFPLWICWLLHLCITTYSSGLAFRPAHLGPSTVVGTGWFLVGLATLWPGSEEIESTQVRVNRWLCAVIVPFAILCSMLGADLLRPRVIIGSDFERYISAIELEFNGLPRDRVLVDYGSWLYLPQNVVMKDRLSPLGTLWGSGTSDFHATADRFRQHYYAKILWRGDKTVTRDLRFSRPLLENYRPVRTIPGPQATQREWIHPFVLDDVTVYEPIETSAAMPPQPASKPPQ